MKPVAVLGVKKNDICDFTLSRLIAFFLLTG